MAKIAKIAVAAATYAIDRPYDYLIPEGLSESLLPGMRVAVPFGAGNRVSDGIVLACTQQEPAEPKRLKYILAQLDQEPMLSAELLQLALWMRDRYFCTVYDAAKIMLPSGLWFSLKDCWRIAPGVDREKAFDAAGRSEHARRVIELLFANGGWAEHGQIRLAFGTVDPAPALKMLKNSGSILQETSASRGIGDKTELVAELVIPPDEALALIAQKRKKAPLQYAAIEALCAVGHVAAKELCYFTGASLPTLRALEKAGLILLSKHEVYRRPVLSDVPTAAPVKLNTQQDIVFQGLQNLAKSDRASASLLYGVTGSGKTLVYIKLIQSLLEQNKSVIMLVPEIALTPQLMERFISHFGKRVALMHSSLSAGERYDEWKRIRNGEARVVVGTRSAIFAPVQNLGAVILDEEQEPSYKSEQTPRYHARDAAKYRCAKANAMLLMGSATPLVESMYYAKHGQYQLFEMPLRYNERELPDVQIVDMRQELRAGNGSCISKALLEQLKQTIDRGEQAILFLNRRGFNRMVTCAECGHTPECPRCSIKLTYHAANQRLMCHHCGHSQPMLRSCPECGGIYTHIGFGTQKAEDELKEFLPGIEILRMDTDTISATNDHEAILARFKENKTPILLGTQMVAKGLDFESVTLVGVLAADQSLYTDDYRGGERTFSLLTQVVGRAGRGIKPGKAVIQTYTPEHDVIQNAAKQDYNAFYRQEILLREMRQLPPFEDILVIGASGTEEIAVLRSCTRMRDALQEVLKQPKYSGYHYSLLGPAPAPVARINNRYRYRLTLHIKNTNEIRRLIAHLLRKALTDKQNKNVAFFADFDLLD